MNFNAHPVILVWTILALLAGLLYRWIIKRHKLKLTAGTAWHILGLLLFASLLGWIIEKYWGEGFEVIWMNRIGILILGLSHSISSRFLSWIKRSTTQYKDDSIVPEFTFSLLLAFATSICFTISPRSIPLLKLSSIQAEILFWDAPLLFLLPFFAFKLYDYIGQVPFRLVENIWIYPLEEVNTEHWPWRDLIRVHFLVKKSIRDEFWIFGRNAVPWIEVPRESKLGNVFQLNMQEHRKNRRDTIQDLGNEYGGSPQFWWLFSVAPIWWNPTTWWRKIRFIDPDLSLAENRIGNGYVIKARRIPMDGLEAADYRSRQPKVQDDPEKTVIIIRN